MRYNRERSDTHGLIVGACLLSLATPAICLMAYLSQAAPTLALLIGAGVIAFMVWRKV